MELVASSIEYGTSTSYELQPAKNQILDIQQLEGILRLAKGLRYRNGMKSLGVQP
jgi:hypothetical protein